jgi:hypothetical protein
MLRKPFQLSALEMAVREALDAGRRENFSCVLQFPQQARTTVSDATERLAT